MLSCLDAVQPVSRNVRGPIIYLTKHLLFPTIVVATFQVFFSRPLHAQTCNFSISDMNFGTIDPTTNVNFDSTATISGGCSGTPNATVLVCMSFGEGSALSTGSGVPRRMSQGSDYLNFSLFTTAARNVHWGSFVWPWAASYTGLQVAVPLGSTGSVAGSVIIYGRVFSGQQTVTPGSYASAFDPTHTLFQYGYATGSNSCAAGTVNTVTSYPTFNVNASYLPTCRISATALSFPARSVLNTVTSATSNVSVTCSNTSPYSVALSLGTGSGVTLATARKMTAGASTIQYGLYRDAGLTQPWGNTAGQFATATGSGLSQSLTVYGSVPSQTTPAPGAYSDTIIATITY